MITTAQNQKKRPVVKNPLEVDSHETPKKRSIVDSLFATNYTETSQSHDSSKRGEVGHHVLFDSRTDNESRRVPQQIESIQRELNQHMAVLERQTDKFTREVNAIKKEVSSTPREKAGIYHVKFLEFLLTLVSQLSAKIGEANSWMAAMQSKKAKRGSAFAARSKSKGTQYSMSQELSNARSVM